MATPPTGQHDDFLPTASRGNLRLRALLLRRLREFFDRQGFLEVDTPILSAEAVAERHLDLFHTEPLGLRATERASSGQDRLWLQNSPEAAMKRLLAAGLEAIYQVVHAFRAREAGPHHNPEFTLVEWYRTGEDLEAGMERTDRLCQTLLGLGPARRLSYAEAFGQFVGIDPHRASASELADAARRLEVPVPPGMDPEDRDGWLDLLLVERVQPRLGREQPVLLYHYPASQAALARVSGSDPPVAERFELFVAGVELANGYQELTDAGELVERLVRINDQREADGRPPLPQPARLLAAMRHGLPDSVGVALGFDRLVMVAAGADRIDQVIAFPVDRA